MKLTEQLIEKTRYLLLAAAVMIIAFGLMRGEQLAVLKKAVNICLECIGIG